jgi:hypothetical protein
LVQSLARRRYNCHTLMWQYQDRVRGGWPNSATKGVELSALWTIEQT